MPAWPADFPASCPPRDAAASDDAFYRLVDSDPVTERDFWSLKQRVDAGLQRMPPNAEGVDECILVGTSVYEDQETITRIRGSVGPLKKKLIAVGSLDNSGVVKRTRGDGHHTWWRPVEDEAWQLFEVVAS
jgi:hypothetical protein